MTTTAVPTPLLFRSLRTVAALVVVVGLIAATHACSAGPTPAPANDGGSNMTADPGGNAFNNVANNANADPLFNQPDPTSNNGTTNPPSNTPDNTPPANTNTPDNTPDNTPPPVDPFPEQPPADALPAELQVRAGVEFELWVNFASERVRVKQMAVTDLDELIVLATTGQVYDYTNKTQYLGAPAPGIRDIRVEPSNGMAWCVFADKLALVNPRTGTTSGSYLRLPQEGYSLRIDAQGRMYIFGPDVSGRGWSLILFNQDGSFLKLVTIDDEIRDVSASFSSNRIFIATATEVFSIVPPRAPEQIVSLGQNFPGGITSILSDDPGGMYLATPDAVLWMSESGALTPIVRGIGGRLTMISTGLAVFDPARQIIVRLGNLDAALQKDRVRARAAQELRDGLAAFARKSYYRAAIHLDRGLRFYPKATRVLYPLAVSRFETGEFDAAAEAWAAFKEAEPALAGSLPDLAAEIERAKGDTAHEGTVSFHLGYSELRNENWRAAMVEFQFVLGDEPDNAAAWYNLAIAQLHVGLPLDAAQALKEYVRLREESGETNDPLLANATQLLKVIADPEAIDRLLKEERQAFLDATAAAEIAGEDIAAARKAFTDFLGTYPDGVYTPYARDRLDRIGAFSKQKEELEKIEAELRKLREAAPADSYDTRYFNSVAQKYAAFAAKYPDTLYLDYILGKLGLVKKEARQALLTVAAQAYEQGRYNSARLIWGRLLEWHPEALSLHYNLGQACRQLEQWEPAINHFEAARGAVQANEAAVIDALLPAMRQRMEAERVLATEFIPALQRKDIDGAEAALNKVLQADDQYGLAWYRLALVWQQKASPEYRRSHPGLDPRDTQIEALKCLTIALRLKPRPDYLMTRAKLYESLRDFQNAVGDYTTLIGHRESWQVVRARAECYRRLANDDAAIADFRRVGELNPQLKAAMDHEIRMIEQNR